MDEEHKIEERKLMASLALQGILSNGSWMNDIRHRAYPSGSHEELVASTAVAYADALIKELSKEP